MRFLIAVPLITALALAQVPTPPQDPQNPPEGQAGGRGAQAPSEPRPYDRVITKDAISKAGVFTVHQIRDTWYYEIPKSELNKEFLWVSQIKSNTDGAGYGGTALGSRVVRWQRMNNRVFLREVKYNVVADPQEPISLAVKNANNDAILRAFNVESIGKEESVVINVTPLFATDVPEFSARQAVGANAFDASRSYIERIATYPMNIEVDTTHTYTAGAGGAGAGASTPPAGLGGGRMRGNSATVVVHHSMVKLPEKPMMPRVFDDRVGYFSVRQTDYGRDEQRAPQRTYITRYRLEKKDPNAALSEPVKPIVYWVDPATPAKYRPWIRKAITDWQPAFEAAGFKNAIIAQDGPTPEQDPNWNPEDARYSVIRWLPSTTENAMGPHISDPRSGEIIEADISVYHNVLNLARAWYFVQAGPLDKRAQKLPLPDELMGRLIEYVVAHEIGHTLGFQHNFKASSLYPIEKIRDREWVHKMGHCPSIMDYSRFNYVAQPEDGIDVNDLIPGIGPYDIWATMWGYKPIPSAKTPDDEKATLNQWALEQEKTPWLRFNTADAAGAEPGEESEAVGDADAVKATSLGIKNLQRVMEYLVSATTTEKGESYDDLAEFYGRVLSQWSLEMGHVANIVGGVDGVQKNIGQEGVRFTPIPRERQAIAVKFLNDNAFATPMYFIRQDILRRIEPAGAINRIGRAQRQLLNTLLNPTRIGRLVEYQAVDMKNAYAPGDFLADLRKGVWKELDGTGPVKIDTFRRNLQRGYVELIDSRINQATTTPVLGAAAGGPAVATDEVRPLLRGELKTLSQAISTAVSRSADRETRLHLGDLKDQIAKALDPKFAPPSAPSGAPAGGRGGFSGDDRLQPGSCWPDYIIK
ncbi:MAG: zinc-dependent metalloprotease [Acidobacteriia bacterium]|nr:zinc-dependent metalloprotease [Terriglobia bacterium]